jgi:hypothetical protein
MMDATTIKRPVPKHRFKISAEHMSSKKCDAALKAFKLKRCAKVFDDPVFSDHWHITVNCTKVEANRLQKCVWEQNHGAYCKIIRMN